MKLDSTRAVLHKNKSIINVKHKHLHNNTYILHGFSVIQLKAHNYLQFN